jgi:NAD(P)-dependent dehydrogenase (short-subunit alcohol dehydrogenase family)
VGASLSGAATTGKSAAYAASKAGLLELTRSAARELAPYKVRINAVCPEAVDTRKPGQALDDSLSSRPLRFGQPEEAAKVILFLCSEASSHLVGQAIILDGGLSL